MKELILESLVYTRRYTDDYPSTIVDYIDWQVQRQLDQHVLQMVLFRVGYSIGLHQLDQVWDQVREELT